MSKKDKSTKSPAKVVELKPPPVDVSPFILKTPINEIGKDIFVGKCANCGNDSYHIKWQQVTETVLKVHRFLCAECKYEIDPENMSMKR